MAIIRTSNRLVGQQSPPIEYVDLAASGSLRLDGFANLDFIDGIYVDLSASGVLKLSGYAHLDYYDADAVDLSASVTLRLGGFADLEIAPEAAAPYFPAFELIIGVNSTPTNRAIFQQYEIDLKIDGVEVEALSASVDADPRGISRTVDIALADVSDRGLIQPDSVISLVIHSIIGGKTISTELINSTAVENSSWNVSATGEGFSFMASDLSSKLLQTPIADFTLYDPNRISLNQAEFPITYDNFGRSYRTQLIGIGSLSLYRILNEVARRCGFIGFKPNNIADYLIERIDFTSNSTYLDALAGLIGMHRPMIYEKNGFLQIKSKVRKPSTLPLMKLNAETIESLSVSRNYEQIDGFIWNYAANELEGSNYKPRYDNKVNPTPDAGSITIYTVWHDFYHAENPNEITESKIFSQRTSTVDAIGNLIGESFEQNQYDRYARELSTSKTVRALAPNSGSLKMVLRETSSESTHTEYGIHPYEPRKQYIKSKALIKTGLNVVDDDDYMEKGGFKQPIIQSVTGGNYKNGMHESVLPMFSEYKYFTPLRNGQTSCMCIRTDQIHGTLVDFTRDVSQGDASIQPRAQNQKMYLFPVGGKRTGKKMVDFYTGPLPIYLGKPLTEMEMDRQLNGRDRTFSVGMIGFDSSIEQGSERALHDHNDEFVANVIIVGFKVDIQPDAVKTQLLVEEF